MLMICHSVFWKFARNLYDAFIIFSLLLVGLACVRIDDDDADDDINTSTSTQPWLNFTDY